MSGPEQASEPTAPLLSGDWSVRTGSRTRLSHADLLQLLGRRLRTAYETSVEAPVPDQILRLVARLQDLADPGPTLLEEGRQRYAGTERPRCEG